MISRSGATYIAHHGESTKGMPETLARPVLADEYQRAAIRTLPAAPDQQFTNGELSLIVAVLRMGISCAKVSEYVKKSICHRTGYDKKVLSNLISDLHSTVQRITARRDIDQNQTLATATDDRVMLLWNLLGVVGEAGELAESALDDGSDQAKMSKEIGDSLWYSACVASQLKISLAEAMIGNIAKLENRYPLADGYSAAHSAARVDQNGV